MVENISMDYSIDRNPKEIQENEIELELGQEVFYTFFTIFIYVL